MVLLLGTKHGQYLESLQLVLGLRIFGLPLQEVLRLPVGASDDEAQLVALELVDVAPFLGA